MKTWISTTVATGVEGAQRGMIAQLSGWWERKEIDLFHNYWRLLAVKTLDLEVHEGYQWA